MVFLFVFCPPSLLDLCEKGSHLFLHTFGGWVARCCRQKVYRLLRWRAWSVSFC
jgi:hypothetical protein